MPEDLDDHRRIFDVCPERVEGAAMFKAPPQLVNVGMFGLASAARSSREPEAEAAEQTQSAAGHALLADQAIGLSQVKLRALIEGKFAAIGGTVQDAKVRKCTGSRFLVFI